MKPVNIIALVGNLAMLVGCIFLILNLSLGRVIFPNYVTLPLMILGIIGNIAALIGNGKRG
ncbi:MAG: hypothetical protein IJF05_01955 [Clostridia bacterium]|nr:hypothetical protein [Clostridia bacterium]